MAKHETQWANWAQSLPRPDATAACPWPHPKLFQKHLSTMAKAPSAEAQSAYRTLMRAFHPDKFNQTIGRVLTESQRQQLGAHVGELAKQINTAFGK